MSDWIRIGSRCINLGHVIEARFHEMPIGTPRVVHLFCDSGATIELRDEDAEKLRDLLLERIDRRPA